MNYQPYRGGDYPGGPGYQGAPVPPYYPPNPYKRPVRQNVNAVAAGVILLELVSAAIVYLMLEALDLLPVEVRINLPDTLYQVLSIILYLLSFGVPIAVMVALIRIPPGVAFPVRPPRPSLLAPAVFFCLGVSYLGATFAGILSELLERFLGVSPTMPESLPPSGVFAGVLYFFSMAVLPAVLEEMMFRGVIMQSLRRFGDGFALVISSLLFAMCHGNLVQIPTTFLVGLAIGYFVLRSGSLVTGMVIHFTNNALIVLLEYLFQSGSDVVGTIANIAFLLVYVVGAGAAAVYLLVRHANMFRVAPSQYPLHESEKYVLFFTSVLPIVYIVITMISVVKNFA